jgi:hypothetical protein
MKNDASLGELMTLVKNLSALMWDGRFSLARMTM